MDRETPGTSEAAREETAVYSRYILSTLDRFMALLDELDEEQLNWRPPAPETNSIFALATHTLGNAEETILGVVSGQPVERHREQEFLAQADSIDALRRRWQSLREQLVAAMAGLTPADLDRALSHPRRGAIVGREGLLIVARHAAEHLGQAELTRDLVRARRDGGDS